MNLDRMINLLRCRSQVHYSRLDEDSPENDHMSREYILNEFFQNEAIVLLCKSKNNVQFSHSI